MQLPISLGTSPKPVSSLQKAKISPDPDTTIGALDFGGASVQISFAAVSDAKFRVYHG